MAPTPRRQAIVLAVGTFLAFIPTLWAGFVYDARIQILTDTFIHDPANWLAVLSGRVLGMDVVDFNRPAMLASLMLDAAIWGRQPFGYHLTSILLHVANVLLVWRVATGLAHAPSKKSPAALGIPPAVPAAFIFALHPLVTEAVCEPTFREDLLVATGSLGALVLAMGHLPGAGAPRPDRWRSLACIACCLLAVASKESGIAAPLLLAFSWLLFRRQETGAGSGTPSRFWIISIGGSCLVVLLFLVARFAWEVEESKIFVEKPVYLGGTLAAALSIEPRILALCAQLVFWPFNQSADYSPSSIAHLPLPLAVVCLVALGSVAVWLARRDRRLLLADAVILLPLVPVSNLWPIYRPVADRYLYLPLAGVGLGVACLLDAPWLVSRPRMQRLAINGSLLLVGVLGIASFERQKVWNNSIALWDDTSQKTPDSFNATMGRADALLDAGRLAEAEPAARRGIEMSQGKVGDSWATLAVILEEQGRFAAAAESLARALAVEPALADPDQRVAAAAMEKPFAQRLRRLLDRVAQEGQ